MYLAIISPRALCHILHTCSPQHIELKLRQMHFEGLKNFQNEFYAYGEIFHHLHPYFSGSLYVVKLFFVPAL